MNNYGNANRRVDSLHCNVESYDLFRMWRGCREFHRAVTWHSTNRQSVGVGGGVGGGGGVGFYRSAPVGCVSDVARNAIPAPGSRTSLVSALVMTRYFPLNAPQKKNFSSHPACSLVSRSTHSNSVCIGLSSTVDRASDAILSFLGRVWICFFMERANCEVKPFSWFLSTFSKLTNELFFLNWCLLIWLIVTFEFNSINNIVTSFLARCFFYKRKWTSCQKLWMITII